MNIRDSFAAVAILISPVWSVAASAQSRAIDSTKSVMTVRVYKTGVFSALGHDHQITAAVSSGKVDAKAGQVELHVKAGVLKVSDPDVSDKDRAEIQSTMLGSEVLDAEHNAEIVYKSTSAEPAGSGSWTVHGNLTLHGQTRPVTVAVREATGHYTGTASLKQSDFGIKPVKAGGGTVRTKDEIKIEFDIQLER